MPVPTVFLSACSRDLGAVRETLRLAIDGAGLKAVVQNYSLPALAVPPRAMLESAIDRADFVIHLAGMAYGGEPAIQPWPGFRCSYTQYEYYYARAKGRPVWTLLCAESGFEYQPFTEDGADAAERTALQRRHRERLANLDYGDVPWPGGAPREHPVRYDVASTSDLLTKLVAIVREVDLPEQYKEKLIVQFERPWFPPARPDRFTAREAEVEKLAAYLRTAKRICVHGPGGIGKTALSGAALAAVAPSRSKPGPFTGGIYSHDFYLSPSLEAALASILMQAGAGDLPEAQRLEAVRKLLVRPALALYLEGCERAEQLGALLELTGPGCTVLYTTRFQPHDARHEQIEVLPFSPSDAVRVIQAYARAVLPDDLPLEKLAPEASDDWTKLAAPFGGFALALELAGHHLGLARLSPGEMLASLERRGLDLFDHSTDRRHNLGILFNHSLDALPEPRTHALRLLHVLALGGVAAVPVSLLADQTDFTPDEIERGIEVLYHHHLIGLTRLPAHCGEGTERAAHLAHALLADWCRENLEHWSVNTATSYTTWCNAWFNLLNRAFTDLRELGGWQRYEALLPLLESFRREITRAEGCDAHNLFVALALIGEIDEKYGHFGSSEFCKRSALEISERVYGPEHPNTLGSLSNLGELLFQKGDFISAETLSLRALEAEERLLGPEHNNTVSTLNNLGLILWKKGDFDAATPLLVRVLEVRERLLGPEHLLTLLSLNNLAVLFHQKGDLAAAEPLYRRAIKAEEDFLGPEHPDTLICIGNFATLLQRRGDIVGSELLHRRILEARERLLGLEHPDTCMSAFNLSGLCERKGELMEALALAELAMNGAQCSLPEGHPYSIQYAVQVTKLQRQLYS